MIGRNPSAGEAAGAARRLWPSVTVLTLAALATFPALAGTRERLAANATPTAPAAAPKAADPPQPAAAATPTPPQKVNGSASAWTVTCVSHARAEPADCVVEQRLFSKESGQLLSVAAVDVPGGARQPVLILQLPTGLALQEGVSVSVDEGPSRPVAVQSCDGRGCYARLPIPADLLEAMATGKVMTIRAMSSSQERLAIPHLLTDFNVAFAAAR
jgi:invasion protein IalB